MFTLLTLLAKTRRKKSSNNCTRLCIFCDQSSNSPRPISVIAELGVVDRKMIAQKMHYLITVVSCLSTTCLFTMLACLESCTDEPSPISSSHNERSVFLDTAFVDPSEVWLRLSSTDLSGASSFEAYRDTTLILSRHIVQPDTTLIDTMLLPAKIYQYRACRSVNNRRVESTRALLVQTMDTTSHEIG